MKIIENIHWKCSTLPGENRAELWAVLGNTGVQGSTGKGDPLNPGQSRVPPEIFSDAKYFLSQSEGKYFLKLYTLLSQHHFVLEVVDKKIVDERYARLKAPVRPSRRLPEQESFSVDLAYCSIDFLVHWSQVFPSDFRRKNQTAVLVIRVEPCRGPRSNQWHY